MIPIAGSAYTYAYAMLGEIFAWIIGWDLILEYAVSNMAVAVGFSAYLKDLLDNVFGWHLPAQAGLSADRRAGELTGSWFNIPALLITAGSDLDSGARRAGKRRAPTTSMVVIKIAAILIFCLGAAHAVNTCQLESVRAATDFPAC